jgi:Flp pilus assembly secretin CpaC
MTLSVCFYRDLERPAERAAISWSVADPSVARVTPMTGPRVTVTGLAFGKTKVRALVTGVTVEVPAIVCDASGACPPPPY